MKVGVRSFHDFADTRLIDTQKISLAKILAICEDTAKRTSRPNKRKKSFDNCLSDGNLSARLYGELLKFEFELTRHFDGGFQDCPLQRDWHNASLEFREIMEGLHPLVTVTAANNPSRKARSSTFFGEMSMTPT